jgi:hypothetical protein
MRSTAFSDDPAAFLSELEVRKIGERTWMLLSDLIFYSELYQGIFIAPRGFQTNFASIPQVAFALCPPIGWYDYAAVIHDAGYVNALVTPENERIFTIKAVVDNLFFEGMAAKHVNPFVRQAMYQAVKAFGDPDGHPLALNRSITG